MTEKIYLNLDDNYLIFKNIISEILSHNELYPGYCFDRNYNICAICELLDNREDIENLTLSFYSENIEVGNFQMQIFDREFTFNILNHEIDGEKIAWLLYELKNKMDFDGETFIDILNKHEKDLLI